MSEKNFSLETREISDHHSISSSAFSTHEDEGEQLGHFIPGEKIKTLREKTGDDTPHTDSLIALNENILKWEKTEADDTEESDSCEAIKTPRTMRMKTHSSESVKNWTEVNPYKTDSSITIRRERVTFEQKVEEKLPSPISPHFCSETKMWDNEDSIPIWNKPHSLNIYGDSTRTTSGAKKIVTSSNTSSNICRRYINQYMLKEKLGQGACGSVWRCKNIDTSEVFAMKILNKTDLRAQLRYTKTEDDQIELSCALDDAEKEIAIMKKLQHRNVLKLIEVINAEDAFYLILEYMPFGSIAKSSLRISKVERDETEHKENDRKVLRLWMRDMVSGLSYLHSQRICHSDIKPENILVGVDGVLKLADFGLSKLLIAGQSSRFFDEKDGTLAFTAPECLDENKDRKFSMFPTDIWALGVTLYQLKYGYLPFHGEDDCKLTRNILHAPVFIPESEDEDFTKMIKAMLEKDPTKRMTVQELCCDPWITDGKELVDLVFTYRRTPVSSNEVKHAFAEYRDLQGDRKESPKILLRHRLKSMKTGWSGREDSGTGLKRENFRLCSPSPYPTQLDLLTRKSYEMLELDEDIQISTDKKDLNSKNIAKAMLKQAVTEKTVR